MANLYFVQMVNSKGNNTVRSNRWRSLDARRARPPSEHTPDRTPSTSRNNKRRRRCRHFHPAPVATYSGWPRRSVLLVPPVRRVPPSPPSSSAPRCSASAGLRFTPSLIIRESFVLHQFSQLSQLQVGALQSLSTRNVPRNRTLSGEREESINYNKVLMLTWARSCNCENASFKWLDCDFSLSPFCRWRVSIEKTTVKIQRDFVFENHL